MSTAFLRQNQTPEERIKQQIREWYYRNRKTVLRKQKKSEERIGKRGLHLCQKLMPLFLGVMILDTREQSTNLQTSQRQERVEGIFTELEQKGRMEDTTD